MDGSVALADYAQVHGGKLNVVGAGINLIGTPSASAPHPINVYAAILLNVPWQAHNQAHNMRVSLMDADNKVVRIAETAPGITVPEADDGSVTGQFNAGRSPIMEAGDESLLPLAVPLQVGLPGLGAYRVVLEVDGTEIASARFRVIYTPQLVPQA